MVLVLWFPDGEAIVEYSEGPAPSAGDRITKRHAEWIVESIEPMAEDAYGLRMRPESPWPEPFNFIPAA